MGLVQMGLGFMTLTMGLSVFAVTAPTSKAQFCQMTKNPANFQKLAEDYSNQISFVNQGGLFGGGICWWHSMFTKKATYLAIYRPDLPKPSDTEAKSLLSDIIAARGVVEIPGFKNLREFTYAYADELHGKLEGWQIRDGAFGFGWIRGLKGKNEVSSAKMKQLMDELYELVGKQKQIIYQKLQLPGIVAHAWLVTGMVKTAQGYTLTVVDSNSGGTDSWTYREGDTSFNYYGYGDFVPYTSRNKDLDNLADKQQDYCKNGTTSKIKRDQLNEDRNNRNNRTARNTRRTRR